MKRSEIVNWTIAIVGLVASVIQIGYFVIDIFDSTPYTARGNDVPTFYLIITGFMIVYGWVAGSYLLASRKLNSTNMNPYGRLAQVIQHKTMRAIALHATFPIGVLISPVMLLWWYGYSHNFNAAVFSTGFSIVALIALISNTLGSLLPILRNDVAIEWDRNILDF